MSPTSEYVHCARAAARAGARVLAERWGQHLQVHSKQRFDYVTDADLASEKEVLSTINQLCPGQAVLSEETPADMAQAQAQDGFLWVVDPLDGTTNYIHGFPHVAVSVALLEQGRPLVGVIRDVTKDEEFVAWEGGGAWLNDQPMSVADMESPEKALFLTGFPFRHKQWLDPYMELFRDVFMESTGARRAGSAALDLAYVAAGRAQGFWELGLKPWDVAAGILLVKEAGGMVSDFHGGGKALWRGDIVAACPGLQGWLQGLCAGRFPSFTEE